MCPPGDPFTWGFLWLSQYPARHKILDSTGLDFTAVRLGIMDGLPGLEPVFREEFSNSVTARCWVHALRNTMAKVPKRFTEAFKTLTRRVMIASDEQAARQAFAALKQAMGSDAPRAVACLEKDLESLLVHYRFDPKLWPSLRTTNPIERVNRELKRRTKTMETLGEQTLRIVTVFVALRLEFYWQQKPVTAFQINNLKPFKLDKTNLIESAVNVMIQ